MLTKPQERWLQALESGDYKQGRDVLHKIENDGTNTFCCLGVACHLFKDELKVAIDNLVTKYSYNGSTASLPIILTEYLNLKSSSGNHDSDLTMSLTRLNDENRLSFKEIAAIVRANPSHYFYDKEIGNHVN